MHFAKISAAFLGLAAFASAFPNPHEKRMVWAPRSIERKDEVSGRSPSEGSASIADSASIANRAVELTERAQDSEAELTNLVQEKMHANSLKKTAKDNVRKNHYRSKNTNVNTIIIVVTVILDIRNPSNPNKRYMKHQVRADNKANKDVIVQVTEVVAITISSSNSKNKGTKTIAQNNALASGSPANVIQTADPNAPFAAGNLTSILPNGAAAPQALLVEKDPGTIVEEFRVGFVVQ